MSRITIDRRGEALATTDLLVNGFLLTRQEIAAEVANFPAATPAESWKAAERAMILRRALQYRAARLAIAAVPQADADGRLETEEDATLRALLEMELRVPEPSEAEIASFYAAHPARFMAPDLFDVSHILFAAAAGDLPGRRQARARAAEAFAILGREPARFAELARDLSACASAQQGGALGQIGSGELVPEFAATLQHMVPGDISAPVETRFGVHLIALSGRATGEVLPLDYVHDAIANRLAARDRHRATVAYLTQVMAEADVRPASAQAVEPEFERVKAFIEEADDERWLKVIGIMNRAADPASAGVAAMLTEPPKRGRADSHAHSHGQQHPAR